MSQEILPTLQWIAIMVLGGLFYRPVAAFLLQTSPLGGLLANILAYVIIALVVHIVFLLIKKAIGEKLVGSDLFGRAEYYLGMLAGAVRFACMLVCLLALMNSRIYSAEELAQNAKTQAHDFEGVSFPTYGTIQHAVLIDSLSGRTVKRDLAFFLISPVSPRRASPRATASPRKRSSRSTKSSARPRSKSGHGLH